MSHVEDFSGLSAEPNVSPNKPQNSLRVLKYAARVLGIVGALCTILYSFYYIFLIFMTNIICLIFSIIQMIIGFTVLSLEAMCCSRSANYYETQRHWKKCAFYCIAALPPAILCPALGNVVGCGLIFCTGIIYGIMASMKSTIYVDIGEASRKDLPAAAITYPTQMQGGADGSQQMGTDQHITLMENSAIGRPV